MTEQGRTWQNLLYLQYGHGVSRNTETVSAAIRTRCQPQYQYGVSCNTDTATDVNDYWDRWQRKSVQQRAQRTVKHTWSADAQLQTYDAGRSLSLKRNAIALRFCNAHNNKKLTVHAIHLVVIHLSLATPSIYCVEQAPCLQLLPGIHTETAQL